MRFHQGHLLDSISQYMEGINFLPPGFRFHPTDEELINYYLKNKVSSAANPLVSIIADINLYKFNPWDLPDKALFGESEWFFFSPRDRKYPNGARPNRSAASGYWKATGTDKPILSYASQCIGVKKALVFYQGRAPNGAKTNWMMHEYRLLSDTQSHSLLQKGSMRLDDWVLCRVRQKNSTSSFDPNGETFKPKGVKRRCFNSGFQGYGYGEEDAAQNMSYFQNNSSNNNVWHHPQRNNSGILQLSFRTNNNSNKNLDFQGVGTRSNDPSDQYSISTTSHESFDSSYVNINHSMKDALDSIKRVLSLGALDEQGGPKLLQPNSKRQRSSLAPSSTCFDSSSSPFEVPTTKPG